jgi:hypothetical protein
MIPNKTILKTPEGIEFIYYEAEGIRIIAEVIESFDKQEAYTKLAEKATELSGKMPRLFYQTKKCYGRWYIILVLEAENKRNSPIQNFEKMVEKKLEKLAIWYINFYHVLPGEEDDDDE